MLVVLLAIALVGLTLLALKLAGVAAAAATGVLVLNGCLLVLALMRRPARAPIDSVESPVPWRPRAFRRMPEPVEERSDEDEHAPQLKAHRL